MGIKFNLAHMAAIIGYRSFTKKPQATSLMEKFSSAKNDDICLSKATGKKMRLELQSIEHDKQKRISRNTGRKIGEYLQSTHNPANEKRVYFDL